tara:strand:- start:14 stop:391 length:378 start_codon:yes stop_codon:yes gene_type:complete
MFRLPNQKLRSISPAKSRFNRGDLAASGTPIMRKDLEDGVLGEANMDGSIYLSNKLKPGSRMEKEVLEHELNHLKDMKMGKLKYDDDSITYNGKTYPRKDGKIKYNGKWMQEGASGFPWEKKANK